MVDKANLKTPAFSPAMMTFLKSQAECEKDASDTALLHWNIEKNSFTKLNEFDLLQRVYSRCKPRNSEEFPPFLEYVEEAEHTDSKLS